MSYRIQPANYPRTGHRIEKYSERERVWSTVTDGTTDGQILAANPNLVTLLWADYVREVVTT